MTHRLTALSGAPERVSHFSEWNLRRSSEWQSDTDCRRGGPRPVGPQQAGSLPPMCCGDRAPASRPRSGSATRKIAGRGLLEERRYAGLSSRIWGKCKKKVMLKWWNVIQRGREVEAWAVISPASDWNKSEAQKRGNVTQQNVTMWTSWQVSMQIVCLSISEGLCDVFTCAWLNPHPLSFVHFFVKKCIFCYCHWIVCISL